MSWDLNDKSYAVKEGGNKIFNNGAAGIVENVTAEVTKKGAEDKENAPEYKIVLKDSEGRTADVAFWYIKEDADDKEKEKYGRKLGHVARCFLGADFKFPTFNSGKEMLDGIMKTIKPVAPKVPVRVLMTYGTTQYPKNFPQVRTFPRFIESMAVNLDDTKLQISNIDLIERPTADATSGETATAAATAAVDDDWD